MAIAAALPIWGLAPSPLLPDFTNSVNTTLRFILRFQPHFQQLYVVLTLDIHNEKLYGGVDESPFAGKGSGAKMARADWVSAELLDHILAAMMPANRLAIEVSLCTGLRISDVLSLKTAVLERSARPYLRDSKTGKTHRVYFPCELRSRMLKQAGKIYVFEGRLDPKKHRTRSAVYKDMLAAVAAFKRVGTVPKEKSISPHSARKIAAVRAYESGGFEAAQSLLVHDAEHPGVTLLYALSNTGYKPPTSKRRKRKRAARSARTAHKGH